MVVYDEQTTVSSLCELLKFKAQIFYESYLLQLVTKTDVRNMLFKVCVSQKVYNIIIFCLVLSFRFSSLDA